MIDINEKEYLEIAKKYRTKYAKHTPHVDSSYKDVDNLIQHLEHATYFTSFDEEYKKEYIEVFNITTKTLDTYFELLEKNPEFRELELHGNQLKGIVGFPDLLRYCYSKDAQKEQKELFGQGNLAKEHYIMLCAEKLKEK